MTVQLNPYLSFRGEARAAMTFYRDVLGGELQIATFGDFNSPGQDNGGVDPSQVMHAYLTTANGLHLMASDVPDGADAPPNGTIGLSGDDAEALNGHWAKLSENGNIVMPLARQMWGDDFGMLVDQFGVCWLINISGAA